MKAACVLLGVVAGGLEGAQGVRVERCTSCNPTHTDNKIRDALAPPEKDYYDVSDDEIWSQNVLLREEGPDIATTWDKK